MRWWEAGIVALLMAFTVKSGRFSPVSGLMAFGSVLLIYAVANLLYVPGTVAARASRELAVQVNGTVVA